MVTAYELPQKNFQYPCLFSNSSFGPWKDVRTGVNERKRQRGRWENLEGSELLTDVKTFRMTPVKKGKVSSDFFSAFL